MFDFAAEELFATLDYVDFFGIAGNVRQRFHLGTICHQRQHENITVAINITYAELPATHPQHSI